MDIQLEEEPVQEMPKRKIVRKPKSGQLRDFTNEEKGEEVDEIEVQKEEKEKQGCNR